MAIRNLVQVGEAVIRAKAKKGRQKSADRGQRTGGREKTVTITMTMTRVGKE